MKENVIGKRSRYTLAIDDADTTAHRGGMAGAAPPRPFTGHPGRSITECCHTHRGGDPAGYGLGWAKDLVRDLSIKSRGQEPGRVGDHHAPAGGAIRPGDFRDLIETRLQRRTGSAIALGHPQLERPGIDKRSDSAGRETAGCFRRSGGVSDRLNSAVRPYVEDGRRGNKKKKTRGVQGVVAPG